MNSSTDKFQWVCGQLSNCTMDDPIDADIAGIGVILSFLLATWLTVVTITVAYFTRSLPRELYNKLDNSIIDTVSKTRFGSVFEKIATFVRHALEAISNFFGQKKPSSSSGELNASSIISNLNEEYEERKRSSMESFMLSLSDQQLFTGIAVVITAFSRRCQISYVTFGIATQLAWCSCITHLVTLASLRNYLDENGRTKRLRICLVSIMFGLLLAMVVYLNSAYPAYPYDQTLIQCATHGLKFSVLSNVLSVAISNASGLRELVTRWRLSVFDESGISVDAPDRIREFWEQNPYHSTLSTRIVQETSFVVIVDQYSSSMWSRLIAILITSAYQVFAIVWRGLLHHGNEWGFGQIMPVILIILPVVSAIEGYWEWDKDRSSLSADESHKDQIQTVSLLDMGLNQSPVPLSPNIVAKDGNETEELDIANTRRHESMSDDLSQEDYAEPRVLNHRSEEAYFTSTQRISTFELNSMEQGNSTNVLRRRTIPPRQAQVPEPATELLLQTRVTETLERPWMMKLHLRSHFRWASLMAILQLTNEGVPFETFLLGSSTNSKDLFIYWACLIGPIIYWVIIVYSWVKISQYRRIEKWDTRRQSQREDSPHSSGS